VDPIGMPDLNYHFRFGLFDRHAELVGPQGQTGWNAPDGLKTPELELRVAMQGL